MNRYKVLLFVIACLAVALPSRYSWSNGVNPPQPNIGPVRAVCTERANGRIHEILRATILNEDGTGETLGFRLGTVDERIAMSAIRMLALSSTGVNAEGYAKATLRRANKDQDETVTVRIRSKARTFALTGFTSAGERVSIDLSACKLIEFAPLGGGTGSAASSVSPPPGALQVLFDSRQSTLSPDARAAIDREITTISSAIQNKGLVIVTGYADPVEGTSQQDSQKLSERRADSVRSYLVGKGIPASAIETLGLGKTQPIDGLVCTQKDLQELASCQQPNRRVEISTKRETRKL